MELGLYITMNAAHKAGIKSAICLVLRKNCDCPVRNNVKSSQPMDNNARLIKASFTKKS
ncbi:hypothetical protein D3C78_538090 [compost metagenome]